MKPVVRVVMALSASTVLAVVAAAVPVLRILTVIRGLWGKKALVGLAEPRQAAVVMAAMAAIRLTTMPVLGKYQVPGVVVALPVRRPRPHHWVAA
jgi:hypothetical protein